MLKEILESTKKTASVVSAIWDIVSAFFLLILYNPSGLSYFHFLRDHKWDSFQTIEMFLITGVIVLITPIILDMPSAWSAAGKKGKFLFFLYLCVVGGYMYTLNLYTLENIIWFLELAAISFMVWGAYVNLRDKRKYAQISTQEIDPLELDENSDMDN
jgi:hypothetical protein